MIKTTFIAGAIAAFSLSFIQTAEAADSCGWFAFAGASKSRSAMRSKANRIGGNVWSVDSSNSANAGKGFWAVGVGPGTKSQARRWRNQYRSKGVSGAYIGNRCFYGE